MFNTGVINGRVPVEKAELYYEESGSGEPVILMHAHSVDRRMWDPQFRLLAGTYRVIRYDFRGYGLSDMPEAGVPFRHADDLIRLMDALDIPKAHLIGLSLGALTATDMLAMFPERVLSAVLASGAIYTDGRTPSEAELEASLTEKEAQRPKEIAKFKADWLESLFRDCGPYRENIKEKLKLMIDEWSAWQPLYETEPPLLGPSLIKRLRASDPAVPVLVVTGEHDSEGSRKSSEAFMAIRPSAERIRLADAGHFSSMETPDTFTSAALRFLDHSSFSLNGSSSRER